MSGEPEVSPEDLAAAEAYLAAQQAKGLTLDQIEAAVKQPVEVLPPTRAPAGFDWSPANPAALDRLIRAVIAAAEITPDNCFEVGRSACGCPEDVAIALRADDRYTPRYQQIAHSDIYLSEMPKSLRSAMKEGGAYALKVGHDITPKVTQDEAEAEISRGLKIGGTKAKIRAIDDLISRLWKAREMLTGGTEPPPEKIAAIVKQVTEQAA